MSTAIRPNLNSCGEPTLCDGNGNSTYLPDIFQGAANLGVIDRTWTRSRTVGGTVQIENTDKILSRPNKFTFGVNYEHGWTDFSADEEVGVLNPGDLSITGLGMLNIDPTADVQTVHLNAANSYLGVYGLDALDVTDKLTVTAGGRFNYAAISLYDLVGTSLNGNAVYTHFNPTIGASYKLTPEVTGYANYSEANRAPTPLELGCANANQPCLIDNFLVSDPPLKQVVSHSIETGLRGETRLPQLLPGRFDWSAGVYRTTNFNDILSVPSVVTGLGYFTNAGTTQRQGIETAIRYKDEKLSTYINYTLTDATFRSQILLGSPNNPAGHSDWGLVDSGRAGLAYERHGQTSPEGRLRLFHHARVEDRRRSRLHGRRLGSRRRDQRLRNALALRDRQSAHLLSGDQEFPDLRPDRQRGRHAHAQLRHFL